ncbi:MAG: hypothetical protein UX85_C0003G0193 [Candidatus Beckwithbacteria bacterium GW2011_GWB1_47_15]|uniref:Uncharacterized protein n=1 Tax=Candidatus Beckwithbacteria bacterium GW2011_GWB1_47_15 TaxID=1618371 RepID=A0A0G1RW20_9BACT|nr:MAG: hypothetical protein UY43_C0001G0267 [Candidatus Beckwithbacteria bacterium GW2011_GWC1_49_16]KKU35188.1 MAG: hypothetical protein UX50_C0005G0011 [Candidatus Beckwithbacteria bacterium GW2011_GWA1_46_30]KKU61534.1 MAG: hypothetical protein UX85_C0003G0193 [Candidatus Beckwithbacteria bacterium GW2011_GWB1_47_15]KKU71738.1 MAG: hypothetical protein UX97_C0004G0061 [Candidatus Beckwithbacteria bacterium GW2011_GWA2_47_25]KKW03836.1 MAG: hypothetical protein UY37_C0004G0129 [Candidatus Be
MTDPTLPVTKEEALRYSKPALEDEIARRRRNIKLFQDQIDAEEKEIQRLFQIIAIIDANR